MKKILGALALALALVGTSVSAQTDSQACGKDKKECCKGQKVACSDSCTNDCKLKGEVCKCGSACAAEMKVCDKKEAKSCDKSKKCERKEAKACDKSKKCERKEAKACDKSKKSCSKK
ncbi:MAG: hypothetical protein Q4A61_02395 [Porphyromonadaceae bacterium]|nr:hypothetical protein [Porphyromonadaceae bacterium]